MKIQLFEIFKLVKRTHKYRDYKYNPKVMYYWNEIQNSQMKQEKKLNYFLLIPLLVGARNEKLQNKEKSINTGFI